MMKKLVLFGAGRIGRSFIGQLFARSGFEVVFIDINESLINELNRRHEYDVIIKSDHPDSIIKVRNVRGIPVKDEISVAQELSDADVAAVSVGQNGFPGAIGSIAKGLRLRMARFPDRPLDIILAENLHDAGLIAKNMLLGILGPDYPLDRLVGLVETSIGRMVPIMPGKVQERDPLLVYAEPYNTLIIDKKAFKNPVPDVNGLAPKDNIKAWGDRKSHIHNFGHAAAAYSGFLKDPSACYLADILEIPAVRNFTREAMLESAAILILKYPDEFTLNELTEHIDDLLHRFRNRALGDTVFRVGSDLKRKLHRNDRILGPLIDGIRTGSKVDKILVTFANGLRFRAVDDAGKPFPGDLEFSETLHSKGLRYVLCNICELDPEADSEVIGRIIAATPNGKQ